MNQSLVLSKSCLRESGMSLIELLMVLAGLGFATLAFTSLLTTNITSQNFLRARQAADNFQEETRSLLSSRTTCKQNFGGVLVSTDSTWSAIRSSILDETGASWNLGGTAAGGLLTFNQMILSDYQEDFLLHGTATLTLVVHAIQHVTSLAPRKLKMRIRRDPSGQIADCIAYAKMEDGIWRISQNNNDNVFFNGGNVGIGTDNPDALLHLSTSDADNQVKLVSTDGTAAHAVGFLAMNYSNFGEGVGLSLKSSRGSVAAPLASQMGDTLGTIGAYGHADGGSFAYQGAQIQFIAADNFTATDNATFIRFYTIGTGENVAKERMRLDENGNLGVGTQLPKATLDIQGTMRLSRNNAAPGACDSDHAGVLALNHRSMMCACDGGNWISTTDGSGCAW